MFNTPKPASAFCLCQILIILAMLLLAGSVFAYSYSGGTGEPNNPYQIADVNDLLELAGDTDNYDKCFILTADINLTGHVFTTAVIASFTGVFDGNGHKISNLESTGGSGLFVGVSVGEIKNLGLENVSITGGDYSNGGGLAGSNSGTINNCYFTGTITFGINAHFVGGLVGTNTGDINNCYSKGVIITAGAYGYPFSYYIGGLVGLNTGDYDSDGSISNSWSSCDVIGGNGSGSLGGLVGGNSPGYVPANPSISNCYSTGTVKGYNSGSIGGLVGSNGSVYFCTIRKCFSTSRVIGEGSSSDIGGLVGSNGYLISDCYSTGDVNGDDGSYNIGGLLGSNGYGSTINNCYSAGDVNGGMGSYSIGGFMGSKDDNSATNNCYFLDVNVPHNGFGTPLTDSQMKHQASFVGWDFVCETVNGTNDIWWIHEDVTYPQLAWYLIKGDFDFNKNVDFTDFVAFGLKWRQADTSFYCGGMDLTGDGWVDLYDIEVFADNWLLSR
jgi:hypothetical protein